MRSGRRPAGRGRARPGPAGSVARYGAPAAFLLAATVAVLLIHSGLGGKTTPAPTRPAATTAPAAATTPTPAPKPKPAAKVYVIQPGDTFGVVATKLSTTVQQLQTLNPGVSSNALHVGQKIRVG